MMVPIGKKLPNIQEIELLGLLGFNVNPIDGFKQFGDCYYLDIPTSPTIECKIIPLDPLALDEDVYFTTKRTLYNISYNGKNVLNIDERVGLIFSDVRFDLKEDSIMLALLEHTPQDNNNPRFFPKNPNTPYNEDYFITNDEERAHALGP